MAQFPRDPQSATTTGPRQLDLTYYGSALWRRRWLLVVVTALVAGTTLVINLLSPRIYAATVEVATPPLRPGTDTRATRAFTLQSVLDDPALARKTLEAIGRPAGLTPEGFVAGNISVEPGGGNGRTLLLTVRIAGEAAAKRAADTLAALAVERLQQLSQDETGRGLQVLQAQAEEARKALDKAAGELLAGARGAAATQRTAGQPTLSPAVSPFDLAYTENKELAQVDTDYRVARDVYIDFCSRLERAAIEMRAEASQYRVTRSALVSGRPVAPRIGRNVVIAGFLAALAAAFGILFVDAIRRYQSQ